MKYHLESMLLIAKLRLYPTSRGVFHYFGVVDSNRSGSTSWMKAFMQIFEVLASDMGIYLGR
jgi:hypothetical protein